MNIHFSSISLLALFASQIVSAAVFDFMEAGGSSPNNSQNEGAGNLGIADASANTKTGTVDGIRISMTALSGSGTPTISANAQGWGVSTNGQSNSTATRIQGAKNESLHFSFDTAVTLDSFRLGNFARGEIATLSFISGNNPFSTGTSLSITSDGSQGPNTDISIPPASIGSIAIGTVLSLSFSGDGGRDALLNEITVNQSDAPAGQLITSIVTEFPKGSLAQNPLTGPNPGSTAIDESNTKGQSFSLPSTSSLSSLILETGSITTTGDFTLEIFRAMDGTPWQLEPIFSDTGTLPVGIAAGNLLRIELPSPLTVNRGSYTFALTGIGATNLQLPFSNALYPAGAASKSNSSTHDWDRLADPDADLIFAVLGARSAPLPAAPKGAPNIIFILADDYGWTDPQCGDSGPNALSGENYGSNYYETPNLARLAAGGLSLTHCFVQPNCAPTRAAILSGQYSCRSGNGVYVVANLAREAASERPTRLIPPSQREDVPSTHTISAEALKAGGYVTAHFGKYHVGNHDEGLATMPENQGYDFNFGGGKNGSPGNYHARDQLFGGSIGPGLDRYAKSYTSTYIDEILEPIRNRSTPSTLNGKNKHVEDAIGDAAIAYMNNHRSGSMAERPFYLQLHNYAVHTPVGASQARSDLLTKYKSIEAKGNHNSPPYAAIAEGIDQTLGRILDYLDDPDGDGNESDSIAADTLVIFTSDNGGHIGPTDNDPLRHRKGSFYNGGIRVPLIAYRPGTIPAGKQSDTLVHAVDFYPTLIEAAGLKLPEGINFDGTSFATHAEDPSKPRDREAIFYHFPGYLDQRSRPSSIAIKRFDGKDYKLIYTYDPTYTGNPSSQEDKEEGLEALSDPWELYNLTDDISETKDLYDGSHSNWLLYGKIINTMAAELEAWLTQAGDDWNAKQPKLRSSGDTVPYPPTEVPAIEAGTN